ncbi:MAG: FprA family A-type flavoprotein [Acutalibacteraceae bacterium]
MKKITNDIMYVGVNDHKIDLFEGQYYVPNGMAYNSYIVLDEKITVFDSVDENFKDEWLENISEVLGDRQPDYLVVQHMEPDHSANIAAFAEKYPHSKIVGNAKTFKMIEQFFGVDFADRRVVVTDGETLSTGKHSFTFVFAPMVHWPEVMTTYDSTDKVLFSADGFGKFGALDVEEDWACEARRYYFGIVGKYGAQVQALLKKAAALDIEIICPLHGPVLSENLGYYLGLYNTWSSYGVESEGVVIAYTSIYGNTKKAVESLAEKLKSKGCPKVVINDLARCDMAEAVEDAFRYGKIILATTTYNGDVFPFMREFIEHLVERGFKNKTVGFIENGSWAPLATKKMKEMLGNCKDLTFTETNVKILSALKGQNEEEIEALAEEILK